MELLTPRAEGFEPRLRAEVAKCSFCGFCEHVCPTLPFGLHRGYGPRGRVRMIYHMLFDGLVTEETLSSIFSCLTCAACTTQCPARVDVAGVVRAAKALYLAKESGKPRHRIAVRLRAEAGP